MVYLGSFHSEVASNKIPQKQALDWLSALHHKDSHPKMTAIIAKILTYSGAIGSRYTELPEFDFFDLSKENWRECKPKIVKSDLNDRMKIHSERVLPKLRKLMENSQIKPDHVLHVSCTGYESPSPLQKAAGLLGWNDIDLTHIYHQGCYAAFPTIRVAKAFALEAPNLIKVMHSELCTLHVRDQIETLDQLVVQTLFGDGYCSYDIFSEAYLAKNSGYQPKTALKLQHLMEQRIPNTTEHMTWDLTKVAFAMTLKKTIPMLIGSKIEELFAELCSRAQLCPTRLREKAIFAIHPGGPKIIETIADRLQLQEWQTEHSRGVLYDLGNISSATVPHILMRIAKEDEILSDTPVVAFGFGPGLTFFCCDLYEEKVRLE